MVRRKSTAVPPVPRKTLSEWIQHDHGDAPGLTKPRCSQQAQALHTRIFPDPEGGEGEVPEPLTPPTGLQLGPLG